MAHTSVFFVGLLLTLAGTAQGATKDVLLVHGAWADASSWSRVIAALQDAKYNVHAVQLCLNSLQEDASVVRSAIQSIAAPVVVVGHSYGGAVISVATGLDTSNVTALVFLAAYAPDTNETLLALGSKFPALPALSYLRFNAFGGATLDPKGFVKYFAAGLKPSQAKVLAVVQKPISGAVFAANATAPGWAKIPSYYQVSAQDQVVSPDLERFFAARMKPVETLVLKSAGHLTPLTHTEQVVGLIKRAAKRP